MTPGARLSAAIEVLAAIETRRRPAPDALKDWGLAHRFAGSGDRAAIAGVVYDALRRKASSAFVIGETTARATVLGMLALERKLDLAAIARLAEDGRYAPGALSEPERARVAAPSLDGAPAWIAGDYPEWLDPHLTRTFGEDRVAEGVALASRAPLDLRVNTLKGTREEAAEALAHLNPQPTRWSPHGLRIMLSPDAKSPAIHAEPAFLKGLIEVQDEGSQLAALCASAKAGEHVVDLCAGAGGKTLALAAAMEGRGQIYATDSDKRRLAPIHARIERAGAHNIQVRTPKGQAAPLDAAAPLTKPSGRIVYITCSVLADENGDQVRGFLTRNPQFAVVPPADAAGALGERAFMFRRAALMSEEGLLMTPRRTDTDGFYVAVLQRTA
jgi:16S rRNA (cytosine967-C5)-methyltransferase